ncbi:hypothetical protein ABZ769_35465 [Streptomyces olivoreticuli]
MACQECDGHRCVCVASFPASGQDSSLIAAHAASLESARTGTAAHVHYAARGDLYVVVRPLGPEATS